MALTEQVILDIASAQRQIDALERQLDQLSTPINVPVNVSGGGEIEGIRRDFDQTDAAVERLNRELDETERSLRQTGTEADRTTQGMLRLGTRGASVFTNLRGSLLGVAAAFGVIQGARALFGFFNEAIDAASSLEESTSKVGVVFGDFADDIEAFASTAPQALGLANREALEFTGTFGNLFVALGLTQDAAADLAPDIVQLGADLASFNNIETTDALDKLRAGLVGEAEPLRVLGVNLTAATTEAKALELGLGGLTGELTEAEKVQARYALIVEQTATAQGDFARTSDSIANQQRTLAARFDDTRVAVGEALLPAFQQLLDIAPQLISLIEDGLVPALATLSTSFGSVETSGFTQVLANVPIAAERIGSTLGGATTGVFNFGQAWLDFVRLRPDAALDNLREGVDSFSDVRISNQVAQSIQDLITTIVSGREPVQALESVLRDLSDIDLPDDEFAALVDRLAEISGVSQADATALFDLRNRIIETGQAAGFTETEIRAIAAVLLDLARGGIDPADRKFFDLSQTLDEFVPSADAAADGIGRLQAEIAGLDVGDQISQLNQQFAALPDGLDAAAAALRNDENEIISDFTTFLDNLESEIAARQAFRDNVALLEALGLDDLAQVFREAGLEAAPALEDGLKNIGELRDAEAALDEEGTRLAESMVDQFARDIAAEPITQALIDEITTAAAAADNEDVRAALEALAQALTLEIPVTFGDIPATPGFLAAQRQGLNVGANVGVGAPGGGVTNIEMNFEGFVPSTPDLIRANQAVNQVTQF